jgi:1,4-dihydroxy-2-naphthoate octaprenyltransferase
MSKVKAWIVSMRLRTLPLALSSIFMGSVTAAHYGMFRADILLWASLTTLFLQILSNLANDYGDARTGADNENRVGPRRMIQTGVITLGQMKTAMIIFVILSLVSGITLLFKAFEGDRIKLLAFFLLGIAAIIAAILPYDILPEKIPMVTVAWVTSMSSFSLVLWVLPVHSTCIQTSGAGKFCCLLHQSDCSVLEY